MNLNFTMSELIHSENAALYNINNMPDLNAMDELLKLIVYCLQPLREALNLPIIITSGYRSKALNDKLKGSSTSQHLNGQAADIKIIGLTQRDLFYRIQRTDIEYDQLIWEQDTNCVHISYNYGKNRNQTLIRGYDLKYAEIERLKEC